MNSYTSQVEYNNNNLQCDGMLIADIAGEFGTPLYLYSERGFIERYNELYRALSGLDFLICYSVKSNANIHLLKLMSDLGSGMDVVSGGEIFRSLKAGVPASKIVYAGVGKTPEEIEYAIDSGILMFNCESFQEIEAINRISERRGYVSDIAIRVNPDVQANTHHYITTGKKENKFGISIDLMRENYDILKSRKNVRLKGIHCHIGSQILEVEPFTAALERLIVIIAELRNEGFREIEYINLGGGMGIQYHEETPFPVHRWASIIREKIQPTQLRLIIEPGRYISGNNGILVVRVVYKKRSEQKTFLITDGAMNDLIRPALYGAYQHILNCTMRDGGEVVDVVGPVCESADFFAKDREISPSGEGDFLAIMSAGAYGMTMASRYNSRKMPAEVLIDSDRRTRLIRRRDTWEDLIANEVV